MRVLEKNDFVHLFITKNQVYTYEDLLKAVAKWPYFCDDRGEHKSFLTDD